MARQFKRAYELTIIPTTGEARIIKELRINFEITKSLLGYPNLAKITLYNPNPDTLAALQSKYTKVVLNAGYEGDIRLLFKGDVRNIYKAIPDSKERTITIFAGDGQRSWDNATFNKTFSENISAQVVIQEVLKSFEGITIGVLEGLPNIKDKLRGQTLSGSSKDIMDNFAEEYGFSWSIQNNEIVTTPDEVPISGDEAILINPATGLIGSPTITEIGADVTTLLNPRLIPNRAFKIESLASEISLGNLFFREVKKTDAEGTYKIMEVMFKGDSRKGEWLAYVKGKSL